MACDAGTQLFDAADHFVAGDDRQPRRGGTAFDFIQLRVTDSAHRDANQNLAFLRLGLGQIGQL